MLVSTSTRIHIDAKKTRKICIKRFIFKRTHMDIWAKKCKTVWTAVEWKERLWTAVEWKERLWTAVERKGSGPRLNGKKGSGPRLKGKDLDRG